jgi:hypothetical protein
MSQLHQAAGSWSVARNCSACGAGSAIGDRFCRRCGAVLAATAPPAAMPRSQPGYSLAPAAGLSTPGLSRGPVPFTSVPRRPSVGVMWANAVLAWSLLPGLYLLYLTVRNIAWARSQRQPWVRYAMPLATVVAVVVVGITLLAQVKPADPYGYGTYAP